MAIRRGTPYRRSQAFRKFSDALPAFFGGRKSPGVEVSAHIHNVERNQPINDGQIDFELLIEVSGRSRPTNRSGRNGRKLATIRAVFADLIRHPPDTVRPPWRIRKLFSYFSSKLMAL